MEELIFGDLTKTQQVQWPQLPSPQPIWAQLAS